MDPAAQNVARVNAALSEFGSPHLLSSNRPEEILHTGVEPDRIDLLRDLKRLSFGEAWSRRVEGAYGEAEAHWIGLDDLIRLKEAIDHPRHQDDVRVLREVKELRRRSE